MRQPRGALGEARRAEGCAPKLCAWAAPGASLASSPCAQAPPVWPAARGALGAVPAEPQTDVQTPLQPAAKPHASLHSDLRAEVATTHLTQERGQIRPRGGRRPCVSRGARWGSRQAPSSVPPLQSVPLPSRPHACINHVSSLLGLGALTEGALVTLGGLSPQGQTMSRASGPSP